jgi:hypothetical protein
MSGGRSWPEDWGLAGEWEEAGGTGEGSGPTHARGGLQTTVGGAPADRLLTRAVRALVGVPDGTPLRTALMEHHLTAC